MRYQSGASKGTAAHDRAAVFVDYDNLFSHLQGRIGLRLRPSDVISELLLGVRQHLSREIRATASLVAAYADFSEIHGGGQDVTRSLYLQGVDPRFVPTSIQRNAAELQLSVDVVESFHTHPDVRIVVIVSGDRPYLPLIQHSLRSGRRPVVVMLRPPDSGRRAGNEDVVINASRLLRNATARELGLKTGSARAARQPAPGRGSTGRPHPVEHRVITHPGALAALDVIEEHFGQYDEIYLTPLLRKLSEVIGDAEYDPKSLISQIEEAGAVWLEKRKGFPYDYTVLLIDADHPNVAPARMHDGEFGDDNTGPEYDRGARYEEKQYDGPYRDEKSEVYEEADYPDEYEDEQDGTFSAQDLEEPDRGDNTY